MEGDKGDGDAEQDANSSTGLTPIRDMVDIPETCSLFSITPECHIDTDGSKW